MAQSTPTSAMYELRYAIDPFEMRKSKTMNGCSSAYLYKNTLLFYTVAQAKKVCMCVCNQLLLCVTPTKTHHHNVNVRESVWNLLLLRLVARARMRIVCCPVIVSNISVSSLSLITKYIIFIYELFDSQLIVMKSKLLNLRDNRLNSNTRDHHQ